MGTNLITLKNIALRLNVPESTLRKYRDAYLEFIPFVGSGRGRRYREEAEEVFGAIRNFRAEQRLSWEDTEEELGKRFPINADAASAKKRLTAYTGEDIHPIKESLEKMAAQIEKVGERQEFIMTTLAGELLRMDENIKGIKTITEGLKSYCQSTDDYKKTIGRQNSENRDSMKSMVDALSEIRASVSNLARALEKRTTETTVSSPASGGAPGEEETASIREVLVDAQIALVRYKNLYAKAKQELDYLKSRQTKQNDKKQAGLGDKRGEAYEQPSTPLRGGKRFFGGKKNRDKR